MPEAVNHPPHYNAHPSGVECIDIVEHMTFNTGNAIKYIWRNGLKEGTPSIQDLEKARWYIDREIERVRKANAPDQTAEGSDPITGPRRLDQIDR